MTVSVGVIQLIRLIQMRGDTLININPTSGKTLYEQIVDSFKSNFAKGYLKPGDEIPSVRKLAMELSVTPNTVAKAYQELERDKIIVTIRGKGTYISPDAGVSVNSESLENVKKVLSEKMVELTCMGMEKEEIFEILESIYTDIKEGE